MIRTVLIVEDDVIIAVSTARMLAEYSFKALIATNGKEAVDIVNERGDIDLVLMDIDLGGDMDGTEAAEIILSVRDIPLIFLSSHTEREVVEKTEGISSYGYVVKNSGETMLIAAIKMALRLYDSKLKEKEKGEALRLSENLYNTLFTLTTHGVMYQDGKGNIIDANPAAEKILGLTIGQMKGRALSDLRWRALRLNGEEFPADECPSMQALKTGKKVIGTIMGIYNFEENGTRWIFIDAVPRFLPRENAPYRVFITFSDITERVLREREVRKLSAEVLLSQEKERERIAAELHDSIGQTLLAAGLNIRAYQLDPVKNASKIAMGAGFIERAIVDLREVYTTLYPSVLRDLGLEAAIRELVNNVLEDNDITVDLNCEYCVDLDREITLHIFRILQEIVSNIMKHSRATSVRILIGRNAGGSVSIEVSDNGKGFLLKRPGKAKQGHGLSNIRQRVDRMGGSLIISSMPGRGTRINIECGKEVQ